MIVPMLDLTEQYRELRTEILEVLDQVMDSSQFVLGSHVKKLEQDLAEYSNASYGIGCGNGSDAIHIALRAIGVGPGDEVITTPFTFFATGGAIARTGAKPVFVDIDPFTFNIDPNKVEQAISSKTKAIIPVHLYGQMADMESLAVIAQRFDLSIIEDAAQAIGAKQNGKSVGELGTAATYSFFPTKNLGAYGDGGMIVTNCNDIAEKCRVLRIHGSKQKYHHHILGYNSRLDELQAAVLNVKFQHLEYWLKLRREKAALYTKLLNEKLEELVVTPVQKKGNDHVYHQYTIRAENRDELQKHLAENGISTIVYYPLPLHVQPVFKELEYQRGDLPEAEIAASQVLSLPIFPELKVDQQEYIVSKIAEFYYK
jgi:dTDP-4-amino-4,6-dideoxygalactose transaminase